MFPVPRALGTIVWLNKFRKSLSHRALDKKVLTGTLIAVCYGISIIDY
jgi:hypothetical protein